MEIGVDLLNIQYSYIKWFTMTFRIGYLVYNTEETVSSSREPFFQKYKSIVDLLSPCLTNDHSQS